MSFDEIVERVRFQYENADARGVYEHVAIQINIVGEVSGIFYIEIADRNISVEPYDYYDKDGLIVISAQTVYDILDKKITIEEAVKQNLIIVDGDIDKCRLFRKVVFPKNQAETKRSAYQRVLKWKKRWKHEGKGQVHPKNH